MVRRAFFKQTIIRNVTSQGMMWNKLYCFFVFFLVLSI